MRIIMAENAGFCFGVKRAVEITENVLNQNHDDNIFSLGPLIHNSQVVEKYEKKGLKVLENIDHVQNANVIIRAHGVPLKTYEILKDNGNTIIDCTCPHVKAVHKKVAAYNNKGYQVIIVGDKEHAEVIGINGFCNNKAIIINSTEEVEKLPKLNKIFIVSQTTNRQEKFNNIIEIIKEKSNEVEIFNSICNATNLRQKSCEKVAKEAEAMIVIGGYHSSNTNKLVEVSKKFCENVFHIETIDDLPLINFKKFNTIGITAGASTPDWIIKEVINKMENMNNEEMIKAIEDSLVRLHRGEIVKGKVIQVTENEVMVNVGYKSDGIITKDELSYDPDIKPEELYNIGDEIDVYVLRLDDGEGNVLLSTKRIESIKSWDDLESAYNNKEKVNCKVTEVVKGGVLAVVEGLNAFIPASLLSTSYVEDLNEYKGKKLIVLVADFDRDKKRIILSRKEVEKEELEERKEKLWNSLEVGKIVEGKVMRLTDFGAFVDIGGDDGLIHISDLAWRRIKHPSEIVKEGQNVEVQILDFNKAKGRISLGLKQTMPEPWEVFMDKYSVGDIVDGTVVNLQDFGAFVKLNVGVDGLLHVSQISNEHVNKPSDVLKLNDKVTVKIIDIKEDDRRISLSIKEILNDKAKSEEYVNENEELEPTIEEIIKDN
ncbi:bifunctional 4-hydroxy-3-methylbut-2-enyl diphosphate reductase/30S ribosomal protein S1 [Anaerosalibacter sp. Marseille-P3206]|uniref:bifunctional 4-hydroxy-3-methylbut-2-enyl diphosphate reductase/30S ribosomal protein S1 n=1 Tax=Anaerosalibacter sp. Marseille-P3206 TaxID=1871005 RepID=UPI0009875837|nr:bifunctional 4-hydroxy-3-methylbut-2-enyl diphosphate reductase/30S ribosomal protein S1 [Anaerosalibacter sp. Marseille-P3206]